MLRYLSHLLLSLICVGLLLGPDAASPSSPLIQLVSASTWDRPLPSPPRMSYSQVIQVELDGRSFFASSLRAAYVQKHNVSVSGNSTATSRSNQTYDVDYTNYVRDVYPVSVEGICQLSSNSVAAEFTGNAPNLILVLSAPSSSTPNVQPLYAAPYPFNSSRSGRQTWIELPQIGRQPAPRDAYSFVHQSRKNYIMHAYKASRGTADATKTIFDSDFVGFAFLFGGSTTDTHTYQMNSLWALDLSTNEWIALGPAHPTANSTSASPKTCIGTVIPFDGGFYSRDMTREGSVDQCSRLNETAATTITAAFKSSIATTNTTNTTNSTAADVNHQVDNFGCPWPSPRHAHTAVVVYNYMYLYGGVVNAAVTTGEIWRLRLDDSLRSSITFQSKGTTGAYLYNSEQLKYLNNPFDSTIDRNKLCPIKWQLLTRGGTSSSLTSRPASEMYPIPRCYVQAAVSGQTIWFAGGRLSIVTSSTAADVWMLDTTVLKWNRVFAAPVFSNGLFVNPAERAMNFNGVIFLSSIAAYVPNAASDDDLAPCASMSTLAFVTGRGSSSTTQFKRFWLLVPTCEEVSRLHQINLQKTQKCAEYDLNDRYDHAGNLELWNLTQSFMLDPSVSYSWHPLEINYPFSLLTLYDSASWLLISDSQLLAIGGRAADYATTTVATDLLGKTATEMPLPFISADKPVVDPTALIPSPRSMHAAMKIGRLMYIYGGDGVDSCKNQMWTYHVDKYDWSLIGDIPSSNSTANWPLETVGSMVTSNSRDSIYQYGGSTVAAQLSIFDVPLAAAACNSDFNVFDTATRTWTSITDRVSSATPWDNATDPSQTLRAAYLTGGTVKNGYLYPRARCYAQGVVAGGSLFMFGGNVFAASAPDGHSDNALWALNLTSYQWRLIHQANWDLRLEVMDRPPPIPPPRKGHSMLKVSEDAFLVLFGTNDATNVFYNSVWLYTISLNNWQLLKSGISGTYDPVGRTFASSIIFRLNSVMVVGGFNALGVALQDELKFDLQTNIWDKMMIDPSNQLKVRPGTSFIALDDFTEIMAFGMADSDSAVHVLTLDRNNVGGVLGPTHAPHDWLGAIPFGTTSNQIIIPNFALGPTDDFSSTSSVPMIYASFSTLSATVFRLQTLLGATYAAIQLFDTEASYSSRTTRLLAQVPIRITLTISAPSIAPLSTGDLPLALLQFNDEPDSSMLIQMESETITSCQTKNVLQIYYSRPCAFIGVLFRGARNSSALTIVRSNVKITDSSFRQNTGAKFGAALSVDSSRLSIIRTRFWGNVAAYVGGAIYSSNAHLNITSCSFSTNRVDALLAPGNDTDAPKLLIGGAVALVSSSLNMNSSTFFNNTARMGGALASMSILAPVSGVKTTFGLPTPVIRLNQVNFVKNNATESGGALTIEHLSEASLLHSSADFGSFDAFYASAPLLPLISGCIFDRNTAGLNGGAVYLNAAPIISNVSIYTNNVAGLAGGALFWNPSSSDVTLSQRPVFFFEPDQYEDLSEGYSISNSSLNCPTPPDGSQFVCEYGCNFAQYGPLIASPPASIKLSDETLASLSSNFGRAAISNALITPGISIELVDAYSQLVSTDNSTFVSLTPAEAFSGSTALVFQQGVADFDAIILEIAPNQSVNVKFSTSLFLPLLAAQVASGQFQLRLYAGPDRSLGLQVDHRAGSQMSVMQIAACVPSCSFVFPKVTHTYTSQLRLVLNLNLFSRSSDELRIWLQTDSGILPFQMLDGATMMTQYAQAIADQATMAASSNPELKRMSREASSTTIRLSNSVTAVGVPLGMSQFQVDLPVPYSRIGISLQATDDRIGYFTAQANFSALCPDGMKLFEPTDACYPVKHLTVSTQTILHVTSAFTIFTLVFALIMLLRWGEAPLFVLTSVPSSYAMLFFLLLLPVTVTIYATDLDRLTNVACDVQIWLPLLSVTGFFLVLLKKSIRVASIARSSLHKSTATDSRLVWMVAVGLFIQVVLLSSLSAMRYTAPTLRLEENRSGDSTMVIVNRCQEIPSFFLATEVIYVGIIFLAGFAKAYQAHSAAVMFNDAIRTMIGYAYFVVVILVGGLTGMFLRGYVDSFVLQLGLLTNFMCLGLSIIFFYTKIIKIRQQLNNLRRQHLARRQLEAQGQAALEAMKTTHTKIAPFTPSASPTHAALSPRGFSVQFFDKNSPNHNHVQVEPNRYNNIVDLTAGSLALRNLVPRNLANVPQPLKTPSPAPSPTAAQSRVRGGIVVAQAGPPIAHIGPHHANVRDLPQAEFDLRQSPLHSSNLELPLSTPEETAAEAAPTPLQVPQNSVADVPSIVHVFSRVPQLVIEEPIHESPEMSPARVSPESNSPATTTAVSVNMRKHSSPSSVQSYGPALEIPPFNRHHRTPSGELTRSVETSTGIATERILRVSPSTQRVLHIRTSSEGQLELEDLKKEFDLRTTNVPSQQHSGDEEQL